MWTWGPVAREITGLSRGWECVRPSRSVSTSEFMRHPRYRLGHVFGDFVVTPAPLTSGTKSGTRLGKDLRVGLQMRDGHFIRPTADGQRGAVAGILVPPLSTAASSLDDSSDREREAPSLRTAVACALTVLQAISQHVGTSRDTRNRAHWML